MDVTLCTLCHGPYRGGPGQQFYQSGPLTHRPRRTGGVRAWPVQVAIASWRTPSSSVRTQKRSRKPLTTTKGGMGVLTILSTQEIDAIAAVLAEPDEAGTDQRIEEEGT